MSCSLDLSKPKRFSWRCNEGDRQKVWRDPFCPLFIITETALPILQEHKTRKLSVPSIFLFWSHPLDPGTKLLRAAKYRAVIPGLGEWLHSFTLLPRSEVTPCPLGQAQPFSLFTDNNGRLHAVAPYSKSSCRTSISFCPHPPLSAASAWCLGISTAERW